MKIASIIYIDCQYVKYVNTNHLLVERSAAERQQPGGAQPIELVDRQRQRATTLWFLQTLILYRQKSITVKYKKILNDSVAPPRGTRQCH